MNRSPKAHPRPPLPHGPFLVVGLARSGAAAARMLAAAGETVLGVDSGHPAAAEGLRELGVEVSLDVDGTELLGEVETVVKSPGVPREAPVIEGARSRGKEVTGELDLAWRALPNPFCAVTGTNGKTTTTEWIGHIHRTAGRPVAVAGNVGTPLASLAGELDPDAVVVCECSSFQLEDTSEFAPECAAFLNLAPDHLDRHGTLEAYRDAKLRIFANQGPDDIAVLNGDEPELTSRFLPGEARRLWFCAGSTCEMSLEDGEIRWQGERLIGTDELPLLGEHNVENAMAAAAASLAMGIGTTAVAEGLRSFEGVAHRLERVRQRGRVLYVNDSKATNVASALAAIDAFDGGLRLILGGSLKGESFAPLVGPVSERCAAVYLIGAAEDQLAIELAGAAAAGVHVERSGTLEQAVSSAAAAAAPGEVVLLSPACASFDAFESFEQRGERFRELVEALP
ncbi:MAG: UDP-N-acetylmuramoyl-L-alanine--D-glutamate ligase [Solirubrobacterales bacterium]